MSLPSPQSPVHTSPVPSSYSRRYHVNPRVRYVEAFDQLPSRELRDRDDRAGLLRRPARQPSSTGAFAWPKPLRVRVERQIVDGDDDRHLQSERRAVRGREPDVEVIETRSARRPDLLPPRAGASADEARWKPARVETQRDRLRRVEHELVDARARVDRPLMQQAGQISPDSCGAATQFTRVDADAHGPRPLRPGILYGLRQVFRAHR